MAIAIGRDLPISTKNATEVCKRVRGKSIERAKKILQDAIEMKLAIPMTRFNIDRGHKKIVGPGRYLPKTCMEILRIIKLAEANAHQKNLDSLVLRHINAHKAATPHHYGRHRGRKMKRSHIEVVVEKVEKKEKSK